MRRHRRFRLAPGTPLIGRKFHFSYSVAGVTRLLHRTGYTDARPARKLNAMRTQAPHGGR
ncbi:winged helix-turn-helix domain-containing protein [Streptomyces sp. NBC_00055]|uniref:winged helix-turn-helix domain-containing protein n=1 Tax=Streptomyces sp. NBC_00055 TaxID=2975632 RepID=UPI00324ACE58